MRIRLKDGLTIEERGWPGHFILARKCLFHRNTLIRYNDYAIVVSTVGLMQSQTIPHGFEEIGHNRFFETMAFHADQNDTRYYDADVSRQVRFESQWQIAEMDADDKANQMHDTVVREIAHRLRAGEDLGASAD
jgi:hypothetical protein